MALRREVGEFLTLPPGGSRVLFWDDASSLFLAWLLLGELVFFGLLLFGG